MLTPSEQSTAQLLAWPVLCRVAVSVVFLKLGRENMSKQPTGNIKIKPKRLSIRRSRSPNEGARGHDGLDGLEREGSLPPQLHRRLWSLFEQIEREFESVHAENIARKWKWTQLVQQQSEIGLKSVVITKKWIESYFKAEANDMYSWIKIFLYSCTTSAVCFLYVVLLRPLFVVLYCACQSQLVWIMNDILAGGPAVDVVCGFIYLSPTPSAHTCLAHRPGS